MRGEKGLGTFSPALLIRKMATKFDFKIVADPTVFKVNCLPAHSDHVCYRNEAEAEQERTANRRSLNGIWKFSYAVNPASVIEGFESLDYDCTGWDSIRVPSNMQMEGYDKPAYVNTQYPWDGRENIKPGEIPTEYNPVGSYITYFSIPKEWKDQPVCISFQGVESGFALYLNGQYVGYSEDSFTASEFDLTPFIQKGVNKLAVRVYKWTSSSWLEDQDFYRFSGIYRDVYLYTVPSVHLFDLKIRALLDDDYKDGTLEITPSYTVDGCTQGLKKSGGRGVYGTTEYILSREGEEVISGEVPTKADTVIRERVESPDLWSAEKPALYDLTLILKDEKGEVIEVIHEKVGFRRFEMKNGIMCINGKRIVFRGVNRHEFSCDTGRTPNPDEVLSDILTMKRNNINALRTSHYPNASMIYRLCDEYGIYMIAENNMESHGYWDKLWREDLPYSEALPGNRKEFLPMLLDRVNSTYEIDKNHPSILIWSDGNESYTGQDIQDMTDYFHMKDPDRLVHYEGGDHDPDDHFPDSTDMYSQMYSTVDRIEKFLAAPEHQDKPLILCEYTHSMGNSNGNMYKYIELSDREPRYQGGFIWDFVDQSVRRKNRYGEEFQAYGGDCGERPTDYEFSGNGILDGTRKPYAKMQEVKACYQPLDVKVDGTKVTIVNRNLFTDTSEYDCVVTVEREGVLISEEQIMTKVPPLSEGSYNLPILKEKQAGEYAVTVSFRLHEDTDWAEKGYEIAFGQGVYTVADKKKKADADEAVDYSESLLVVKKPGKFKVNNCVHNVGVQGDDFDILLSKLKGGIVSYRYGGKELIDAIPRPNFWRAPISNDYGNKMPARYGVWKLASLYQDFMDPFAAPYTLSDEDKKYPIVKETKEFVDVTWKKYLPTVPMSACFVTYRIFADGTVRVIMDYDPVEGLPPMPEFGFMFKIDADYDHLTFYGMGPDENYCDRNHGARLGVYEVDVKDNVEKYLVPQETGNRTGVRWARVTDYRGRGIEFRGAEFTESGDPMASKSGTFEISVTPYTPEQLEEAAHAYELPRVFNTVVRLSLKQMGVGGDDSWGARTHDEFLLPTDKKLQFAFEFKGI